MTHAPFRGDRSIRKGIVRGFASSKTPGSSTNWGGFSAARNSIREDSTTDPTEPNASHAFLIAMESNEGDLRRRNAEAPTRVTRLRSSSLCRAKFADAISNILA